MADETTPAALMARVHQADGLMTKHTGDMRVIVTLRFPVRDHHVELISTIMSYEEARTAIHLFDPDGSIRERSMKNTDLALYK